MTHCPPLLEGSFVMMVTLGTKFPTYEFWGNTPSYGSTGNAIQVSLVEQAHLLPTLECDAEREAVCAV